MVGAKSAVFNVLDRLITNCVIFDTANRILHFGSGSIQYF